MTFEYYSNICNRSYPSPMEIDLLAFTDPASSYLLDFDYLDCSLSDSNDILLWDVFDYLLLWGYSIFFANSSSKFLFTFVFLSVVFRLLLKERMIEMGWLRLNIDFNYWVYYYKMAKNQKTILILPIVLFLNLLLMIYLLEEIEGARTNGPFFNSILFYVINLPFWLNKLPLPNVLLSL